MGLKVTWGSEEDRYASCTDREGNEIVLALFRRGAKVEIVGTDNLPSEAKYQDRAVLIVSVAETIFA